MNVQPSKPTIQFINHASVLISYGDVHLLCDPWFAGDAFHKGWNLIVENTEEQIESLLQKVTHIWVSHEHPDHFSIPFFNRYAEQIRSLSITLLFQKISDRRVANFLQAKRFVLIELPFNESVSLSHDFSVVCIKDGFYDSALLVEAGSSKILNLNDCVVNRKDRAQEIFSITGQVDILLTQFSYAAWKGGRANRSWRELAAQEKLDAVDLQVLVFQPSLVIPFASFSFFSNQENFYLNDAVNRPEDVTAKLKNSGVSVAVMKPLDCFDGQYDPLQTEQAIAYWSEQYSSLGNKKLNQYSSIQFDDLNKAFNEYSRRIVMHNSLGLMKFCRALSPVRIFHPVYIHLSDLDIVVEFDYVNAIFRVSEKSAQLSMCSESLWFIFKNTYGFNTLTVNGCFEEVQLKGFVAATKTLAIENLNNLGVYFKWTILFNPALIALCFKRLWIVSKKLMLKK